MLQSLSNPLNQGEMKQSSESPFMRRLMNKQSTTDLKPSNPIKTQDRNFYVR